MQIKHTYDLQLTSSSGASEPLCARECRPSAASEPPGARQCRHNYSALKNTAAALLLSHVALDRFAQSLHLSHLGPPTLPTSSKWVPLHCRHPENVVFWFLFLYAYIITCFFFVLHMLSLLEENPSTPFICVYIYIYMYIRRPPGATRMGRNSLYLGVLGSLMCIEVSLCNGDCGYRVAGWSLLNG